MPPESTDSLHVCGMAWNRCRSVRLSRCSGARVAVESNVLANALYSNRSVKLLEAKFAALFGTRRGMLLQEWAAAAGVALAWAYGDGRSGKAVWYELNDYGPWRAIDAVVLRNLTQSGVGLNASTTNESEALFSTTMWRQVNSAPLLAMALLAMVLLLLWHYSCYGTTLAMALLAMALFVMAPLTMTPLMMAPTLWR